MRSGRRMTACVFPPARPPAARGARNGVCFTSESPPRASSRKLPAGAKAAHLAHGWAGNWRRTPSGPTLVGRTFKSGRCPVAAFGEGLSRPHFP